MFDERNVYFSFFFFSFSREDREEMSVKDVDRRDESVYREKYFTGETKNVCFS